MHLLVELSEKAELSLEGAYGDAAAGGATGAVNGNVALQFKLQGGKERFNIYRVKNN